MIKSAATNFSPGGVRVPHSSAVVFRESVRKNARDSFEKNSFAENHHFHGAANLGYIAAISAILRSDAETLDLF